MTPDMKRKRLPVLKLNARGLPGQIATHRKQGRADDVARCERILSETLAELRRRGVTLD